MALELYNQSSQNNTNKKNSFNLAPEKIEALMSLCGENNNHLLQIEKYFNVSISSNSYRFQVEGKKDDIDKAEVVILNIYQEALNGSEINLQKVHLASIEKRANKDKPNLSCVISTPKLKVKPRGANQLDFVNGIRDNTVQFATGPAGTGKTWLAVACAIEEFFNKRVERLILTRPAVEAGEKLGFLPGDLSQKVDPYLRPLFDALYDMLGTELTDKLIIRNVIEIAPLAFMRGRSLNNSCIILDEGQNTTPEQMKMLLTRIGFGSKAIITGDLSQVDLPKNISSGLVNAISILNGVDDIGFTFFKANDVIRHNIVQKIVCAYENSTLSKDK